MAGQREATWGSSLGLVEKIQLLGNSFQLNETGTNEKRGAKLIPPHQVQPPFSPLIPSLCHGEIYGETKELNSVNESLL